MYPWVSLSNVDRTSSSLSMEPLMMSAESGTISQLHSYSAVYLLFGNSYKVCAHSSASLAPYRLVSDSYLDVREWHEVPNFQMKVLSSTINPVTIPYGLRLIWRTFLYLTGMGSRSMFITSRESGSLSALQCNFLPVGHYLTFIPFMSSFALNTNLVIGSQGQVIKDSKCSQP